MYVVHYHLGTTDHFEHFCPIMKSFNHFNLKFLVTDVGHINWHSTQIVIHGPSV